MTDNALTRADLFNCLPDHAPPDWSQWVRLEFAGVRDAFRPEPGEADPADRETCFLADCTGADAESFAVYAVTADGDVEPVTDIADARAALVVASTLARISGLPLALSRHLGAVPILANCYTLAPPVPA